MGVEEQTSLERELTELLEVERFEPPAEFRERALLADPAVYEEAAADPEAWWLRQATELLDWTREPSEALDESNPPFYKWFADGRAERLRQLPRPPRRGRARRPRRLPLARRGGGGARRHLRRAARRHAALRQRAARPRDREGRRGRDLPADDPRGGRRDARLRPDRRRPQRRLRRLLGGGGAGADGVLRGEGAGHRRRRPPQGQDGADQGAGRRGDGGRRLDRDDLRRPPQRRGVRDARGPRRLVRATRWTPPRPSARPSRSTPRTRSSSSTPPARPRSRRGSCTPPAAT